MHRRCLDFEDRVDMHSYVVSHNTCLHEVGENGELFCFPPHRRILSLNISNHLK